MKPISMPADSAPVPGAARAALPGGPLSALSPAPLSAFLLALFTLLMLAGCYQSFDAPKPIVTEGALADVLYEPARRLVSRSCADCHAKGGNNATHPDAWGHAIRLDSYQDWIDGRRVLLERLDTTVAAEQDPPVDVMPSAGFRYPLTGAERDTLLQWIRRDSPNTESGFAAGAGP